MVALFISQNKTKQCTIKVWNKYLMFIFLKLVLGLDNYKQVIHPDGYLVGNFKAAWNILTIFHIVGYLVPGPLPTKYQHSSQPSSTFSSFFLFVTIWFDVLSKYWCTCFLFLGKKVKAGHYFSWEYGIYYPIIFLLILLLRYM